MRYVSFCLQYHKVLEGWESHAKSAEGGALLER